MKAVKHAFREWGVDERRCCAKRKPADMRRHCSKATQYLSDSDTETKTATNQETEHVSPTNITSWQRLAAKTVMARMKERKAKRCREPCIHIHTRAKANARNPVISKTAIQMQPDRQKEKSCGRSLALSLRSLHHQLSRLHYTKSQMQMVPLHDKTR